MAADPTARGPLDRIRVIDMSVAVAGPSATQLLAFMGAEVIHVTSAVRRLMPATDQPNVNTIMLNKRSIRLNLTQPDGLDLLRRLVRVSDVLYENQRPGAIPKLGLGYEALREIKPDIILVSFNTTGYAGTEQKVGNALTFAALGGVSMVSGYPEGPPAEYANWPDIVGGCWSVFGLLYALHHRAVTGEGQFIDTSAQDSLATLIGDLVLDWPMNHRNPTRQGNAMPGMAPHEVYRCAGEYDWISIAVANDREWRALCDVMGQAELADDPRFSTYLGRARNAAELDELIGTWTAGHTSRELMELLQAAGVAAIPVWGSEVMLHDPHLRAQERWVEVDHATLGRRTVMAPPWQFSGTPASVRSAAPLPGQDEEYVFGELLGLPADEIDALRERKVIF